MSDWTGYAVVYGPPAQKGSVRAFASKSGKVIVKNDNERARGWEQELRCAMLADAPQPLPVWAVQLTVVIRLRRPQSHYGTGRNADRLRDSAPEEPLVKPDVDKCLRLILDAGTGYFWRDDSHVVSAEIVKGWAEDGRPRTEVHALARLPAAPRAGRGK